MKTYTCDECGKDKITPYCNECDKPIINYYLSNISNIELIWKLEEILKEVQNRGYKTFCLISKYNTTNEDFNIFISNELIKLKGGKD